MLLPFAKKGSETFGVDPDKDSINYGKKIINFQNY